jgi:hypothetical protein
MKTPIYGILDNDNVHTDVSKTERGAKQYATRNGYKKVSVRHGYNAFLLATKEGKKWVNFNTSVAIPKKRKEGNNS